MAIITDLGVDAGGILQPKLKNRWRVTFLGLVEDAEPLRVQAITADRPKINFEQIQLDRYNSRAYIAGKYTFEPVNITFEDDIGGGVTAAIQSQIERQQKLIGLAPAPRLPAAVSGSRYKFTLSMEMLDGDDNVFEEWILQGAYFEGIDYTDLDYNASETVKITVTVRYDHASQRISGLNEKATGGALAAIGAALT
jgi:hypothetical protein